jgi:hypothetical protein
MTTRGRAGSHDFADSGDVYQLLFGLCLILQDLMRPLVIHEVFFFLSFFTPAILLVRPRDP